MTECTSKSFGKQLIYANEEEKQGKKNKRKNRV